MLFGLLVVASNVAFAHAALVLPKDIPDGRYIQQLFANGTRVTKSVDTDMPNIISHEEPTIRVRDPSALIPSAKFAKRADTFCWGYFLDKAGIDPAANGLAELCGDNGYELDTQMNHKYAAVTRQATMVYYCVDGYNYNGNCNRADVRYGLAKMDSQCRLYEAGYFEWPGSPEILGKARTSDTVCV
jgi:hypothetical protein